MGYGGRERPNESLTYLQSDPLTLFALQSLNPTMYRGHSISNSDVYKMNGETLIS